MDIPRPTLVKQMRLYLSAEGRGFTYLLADLASGKILRLTRQSALHYERFTAAIDAMTQGRQQKPEDADARQGMQALSMLRGMRDGERFPQKRFNPLMMNFPLFHLAPYQPAFAALARHVFGVAGAVMALAIVLTAIVFGIRNDWAIVAEFNDIFSIEALITFGLIAPFLKLIHEFGHFLAATKYGVQLRKAGLNVIGLFPVPYVDASEADLTAGRGARIMISAAGILTDMIIGAALLIAWHLVEHDFWSLVIGRAFVFNTLNSLLFNANPLMRADGYFIVADAIGRRNFGTEGQMLLKRARSQLFGTPHTGGNDWSRTQILLLAYAVAALIYRIYLTITILWGILPRYLGVGLMIGAWGALAMAQTQMDTMARAAAAAPPPSDETSDAAKPRISPKMRAVILAALLTGAMFIPFSSVAVIDLAPDVAGAHALTVPRAGTVVKPPVVLDGQVSAGQVLLELSSSDARNALAIAEMELVEAKLGAQIGRGAGAAGDQMGAGGLESAEKKLALAKNDVALLTIRAAEKGEVQFMQPLRIGQYLAAGKTIGQFIPSEKPVTLTGVFPESRVTAYERGVTDVTLWDGVSYTDLPKESVALAEQVKMDQKTMSRGFLLRVTLDPKSGVSRLYSPQIKLRFSAVPLWQHLLDWGRGIVASFRDAEIAERQQRIETP